MLTLNSNLVAVVCGSRDLQPDKLPGNEDDAFDSWLVDRTFSDQNGNMVSGISIINKNQRYKLLQGDVGRADEAQNQTDLPEHSFSGMTFFAPGDNLDIYRINAVDYKAQGNIGTYGDNGSIETDGEFCGTVKINELGAPVIESGYPQLPPNQKT
jgi:hypothetical protein